VFDGGPLTYLLIRPDDYRPEVSYPLVILLHGFGASMYDLAGLTPAISSMGYMYACPNAPYPLDIGGGQVGYSWSRGRPGMPEAPDEGPSVEERLAGFLEEVMAAAGAGAGRVLLGGFSQGGGLTLRFGLPRPQVFAGLAVMSGAFRDADGLRERLPATRDLPIFLCHGIWDHLVAVERGRETKAFLEAEGYSPEYHEYQMAHEISGDVVADLKPWLERVLPPAST
jgi:phospholipase/carboxylesterase